ncbi:hypothetical protein [Aerococcus suis]|uniref:TraX protein n=1 Tax=Aerococcus suis TaxID=371602 RepID=A0A1W1Y1X5_9LACT|nr:hypothetical protein [Aerococcus suis]MCI7239852.1 hypothetical protein [Aerococcus suis]MDD7757943.1 hypothetical protein [Aerococcus suis]MDY4647161.1 hypothetical protein [Aerococcus suis]SMC30189.1 hypothetical protein SAMN04487984_0080 [Aerococcus suis]
MTKQQRNALMILALTLIWSGIHLTRTPEEITIYQSVLSLLLPIIGIIFALNIMIPKWRWTLIGIYTIIFLIMLFITVMSF